MKKQNIHKFLYFISILLILGFVIRLGADFLKYNTYLNSAPFYVFVIARIVEFLVPSSIIAVIAKAFQKKYAEFPKEVEPIEYKEVTNETFVRKGFIKAKDAKKKVCVMVNEESYEFDYETNVIYEIPEKRIKFAVCTQILPERRMLFINQDFIPSTETTSPYRTFYEGLMKEPFRLCYPFDNKVIIDAKRNCRLQFWVEKK